MTSVHVDTTLSPDDVQALFASEPAATYIDVRTVAEFANGHPKGNVVNIPIEFYRPHSDEVFPNASFLEVVGDERTRDARLIMGCDAGERSQRAARELIAAGYGNVAVMAGGLKAWRERRLPITGDNRPGVSYASLLTAAKRRKK